MADRFYDFYDYPSWITENWQKFYDLAESYKKSIRALLYNESNFQEGIYSERDIFPILFLFRHYLELILKSIILEDKKEIKFVHSIKELLDEMNKPTDKKIFSEESLNFINWIIKSDDDGFWFRYPTDKKMNEKFVVNNENLAIGIRLSYVSINISQIFSEIEKLQSPNPTSPNQD